VTATPPPPAARDTRPSAAQRFGYGLAVVLNGLMLWVAHQLLDWGWPGFLTADYEDLLPWVTVSFVASMAANAAFVVHDRGWFRPLADLITSVIGLAVAVKTWTVFPFDFSTDDRDWTGLARVVLVIAIVGTLIGVIVNAVKLIQRLAAAGHGNHRNPR
jgi:hypothetical protein